MSHEFDYIQPPSRVIAAYLITLGLASDPEDQPNEEWPIYVDREPDRPDELIKVTETQGRDFGYTQISSSRLRSERQEMPGFQLLVRGTDSTLVYRKIRAVSLVLDRVLKGKVYLNVNGSVILSDPSGLTGTGTGTGSGDTIITYQIDSVTRTTNIAYLGRDVPQGKRILYAFNGVCSIRHCF